MSHLFNPWQKTKNGLCAELFLGSKKLARNKRKETAGSYYSRIWRWNTFCLIRLNQGWGNFELFIWLDVFRMRFLSYLADSAHTNVPPSWMAGCPVDHGAAVTVEEVFSSGHAVQLTGVLSCERQETKHFNICVYLFYCHETSTTLHRWPP